MPTSATGKPAAPLGPRARQRGFTLLELMVVVAIVAIATAAVALALRDTAHNLLDQEAQSLVSALESARAESRATGVALLLRATPQGFEITGGSAPRQQAWSHPALQAQSAAPVVLGPEPVIGPQSLRLWSREAPESSRWIRTDGLRAFKVQNAPTAP